MKVLTSPGYSDLFDGAETMDALLSGIPSDSVLQLLSWLNAQFIHLKSSPQLDAQIRGTLTRCLTTSEVSRLGSRLLASNRFRQDARIFYSPFITHFIHFELTHFRTDGNKVLDAEAEYRILKAYLLIIDKYHEAVVIPQADSSLPDHEYFNQRTWPFIFKQYELNREADLCFETTRLYLLFDELAKSPYAEYLTQYCANLGCASGPVLVKRLVELVSSYGKSNDGKTKVNRLVGVSPEYLPLLDSLSHSTQSTTSEWAAGSLRTLKERPLYKTVDNEYLLLNINYLVRAIYQAVLRDFYHSSGISAVLEKPGTFKSWVAKEVTEKRLFRTLVSMSYASSETQPLFPDGPLERLSDACIREGRSVVLMECKDVDVGDQHQVNFDYASFTEYVSTYHLLNSEGKAKSVLQLGRNATELMSGEFPPSFYGDYKARNLWVQPVLVCDGYLYSAPGVNDHLNQLYVEHRTTRTARLVVFTLEYLFKKLEDLKGRGLSALLIGFHSTRTARLRQFRDDRSFDGALLAFASIEEVCSVRRLPYLARKDFLNDFYNRLGLPLEILATSR